MVEHRYWQSHSNKDTVWDQRYDAYLCLHSIIAITQVLQVGGCVGLHRGEVVLQHVDHLHQLWVTPRKLPGITGGVQRYQHDDRHRNKVVSLKKHRHSFPQNEYFSTSGQTDKPRKLHSHPVLYNNPLWSHLDYLLFCMQYTKERSEECIVPRLLLKNT